MRRAASQRGLQLSAVTHAEEGAVCLFQRRFGGALPQGIALQELLTPPRLCWR